MKSKDDEEGLGGRSTDGSMRKGSGEEIVMRKC